MRLGDISTVVCQLILRFVDKIKMTTKLLSTKTFGRKAKTEVKSILKTAHSFSSGNSVYIKWFIIKDINGKSIGTVQEGDYKNPKALLTIN